MTTAKRIISVFLLALCLLLSGCRPSDTVTCYAEPTAVPTAEPTPAPAAVTTLRVVSVLEDGSLVLAHPDEHSGIYWESMPDDREYRPGMLLEITFSGEERLSDPASLIGITGAESIDDRFDDRCALYLQVLEDLWEEDPALQADTKYVGIDLSRTSLSKSEQYAVAWCFGSLHGKDPWNITFDELVEQGYVDEENLYWADGCLLSIVEEGLPDEESYHNNVLFRAEKWRSGLGAIMFTSCSAEQDETGHWGEYTVRGWAIA